MATGLNLEMLADMGFDPPAAAPNDMLVALVTTDEAALAQALDVLEAELAGTATPSGSARTGEEVPPRTTFTAVRRTMSDVSVYWCCRCCRW